MIRRQGSSPGVLLLLTGTHGRSASIPLSPSLHLLLPLLLLLILLLLQNANIDEGPLASANMDDISADLAR